MKNCIALNIILFFLLSAQAVAQGYYFKQYRVEEGLPTDIVKSSIQDSLGYFWIATDEGLVKYDGLNFTTYQDAMGNYAKGFLMTRSGRLLAFSDLDFIEIKNLGDTVIFSHLWPVSTVATGSTLSYPKLMYEDTKGALWVSESQSVVRLHHNTFKRYEFGPENRTPQFLRSFSIFEDQKKDLFVSSFQGNVFRYNELTDEFDPVEERFPMEVEFAAVFDDRIVIGSTEGVFEAMLSSEGGFRKPRLRFSIPFVSYVTQINEDEYFIATRRDRQFIGNLEKETLKPVGNPIDNVKHVYLSHENDLWISGNEGLIMMKENLFHPADEGVADFLEGIAEDTISGVIYYATNQKMYAFDPATEQNRMVLDIPGGYFQSLLWTEEGIWVANAFRVFLFSDGKIKKEFDFSNNARFVKVITADPRGNVWFGIPGGDLAYMIDSSMSLHEFKIQIGKEGVIGMIRATSEGIYIASSGKSSYLFYKAESDSVFRNISLPIPFVEQNNFSVSNLVATGDQVWLATSEGLMKVDHQNIERVNLGETFTKLPYKSIGLYSGSGLLLANAHGLLLYDTESGDYELFNESSGLVSRTIVTQGIHVSKRNTIWIGTSRGLCYTDRSLLKQGKTLQPRFTQVSVNGARCKLDGKKIDHGSFLSVLVSSITFPENEVAIQYRLQPNTQWVTLPGSEISLTATNPGKHKLEVRAKKNGPYYWSDSSFLNFTVVPPFWHRGWFYLLCTLGVSIIVAATFLGVNAQNKKRNKKLQALIDDRTRELRHTNEDLLSLNIEKNNLIGLVAHDLKNPLNHIIGLLSIIKISGNLDKEPAQYLDHIERSTSRLNEMIAKILDIDAIESNKISLKMETVNISNILNTVADQYALEAGSKNISISRQIDPDVLAFADRNYIEQVFENLLSNAVKFSPFDRTVFVSVKTQDTNIICEFRDEGPGLSAEDKKKLFGKFQKLSARPTANEPSTGLGLSIVKKLVKAMAGEIWCESEPGKGASFFVSLHIDPL